VEIKSKIPIRLLYVEDEAIIRDQLERLLKRVVKEVVTASNGEEGLKAFKEHKPEIIVTDIKMPQMTGLEMAKEIRKIDKAIPIVITTAHSESEFLLEAIEISVSDFLLKPVDTDNLIAIIEKKSHDIILEKELEKERRRFETILNFQDNMIVLTDGVSIVEANKSFFDFFGCTNLSEFKTLYGCIDSQLVNDEKAIHRIDGEGWIKNLLDGKFERNIAKIVNVKNSELRTFMVKATKFPEEEEELYIVSMSDITDMEEEAKTLERLATTDPLTKVYNRLKLNELLAFEVKKAERYGLPLSLIMLDIDHFKDINDTYGHDVGDEVLVKLCEVITSNIRDTDVFARWGGEEFMIMLPNTNTEGAEIMGENLRRIVEESDFDKAGKITASFGIAVYKANSNMRDMLKRVDDALYSAKRGGRNMVSCL
jgi:two-component system, cell cycle response regulator